MLKEWKFNGEDFNFDWSKSDDQSFSLNYEGKNYDVTVIKKFNDHKMLINFAGKNHMVMKSGELLSIGASTITGVDAKERKKGKASGGDEEMTSPMPGKILKVLVNEGDTVEQGAGLVVMEAMKMEHTIKAAFKGIVSKVLYKEGDLVDGGVDLVDLTAEATKEGES